MSTTPTKTILAIASGGGHWIQLLRLRSAFEGHRVIYASVDPDSAKMVAPAEFRAIPDANRSHKIALLWLCFKIAILVLRVRPHIVITTGAAPGYFAVRFGRLLGAKTLFIDSIANAERLSLSAQLANGHADKVLTQWPDLAQKTGAHYHGGVL
jgi:UDP-N-acetylglucosamine:LPS N-acetylglucosamine transferase